MIWYFFLADGRMSETSWRYPVLDESKEFQLIAPQYCCTTHSWLTVSSNNNWVVLHVEPPKPARLAALLLGLKEDE